MNSINGTLYPRYITPVIIEAMADTPVVCLLGPRQVGKTTLVRQLGEGRVYISFDDATLVQAAKHDPVGFLHGFEGPVILDEVQRVPELLPAIKAVVDRQRTPGRFLLTGSANLLLLPGVQESLAGRVEIIHLFPLTEQEKQCCEDSLLQRIIEGRIYPRIDGEQMPLKGIEEAVCRGGFPEPNFRTFQRARQWHRQYVDAIIQRDVKDIAAIRDEEEMKRLLTMLSYRTANLINVSTLAGELGIRRETVEKYMTILERLFLTRRLPAWHRNQAKRLLKTSKVHLVDSGLAATLSGMNVTDWNDYGTDFGPLLETFVVQQLMTQAGWVDPELRFSHYRDKDRVEVDLVIEQGRAVYGVEVKKAASIHPKDSRGLTRLAEQAGKHFKGGILLYSGNNCLPLAADNCYAVPMSALWGVDVIN